MRFNVAALLALALSACASAPTHRAVCSPLLGADQIWRNPNTRYVLLGEQHGTREMPAAAAELVCDAASNGAKVVLGLEYSASEEAALNQFIAGEIDLATLTQRSFWQRARDGRTSRAMVAMLERVRTLKAAGQGIEIVAIIAPTEDANAAQLLTRFPVPDGVDGLRSLHDIGMAARIIDESARRNADRTIVLIGNAHAETAPSPSASLNITSREITNFVRMHTAAAMPREATLALNFTYSEGTSFGMRREGSGAASMTGSETELSSPAVVIAPSPPGEPSFDGRVFVGPITASPPYSDAAQ